METDYTRAQRYVELAKHMRQVAKDEGDPQRKNELLDMAWQYDRLAEKLVKQIRH